MEAREERLAALTGLRFLAALALLLFHVGAALAAHLPGALGRVQRGGFVWVSVFYVLSGFVLARAHPAPMPPAARRAFWTARLARLYPAYLVGFLLSAPFAAERWVGAGPSGLARMAIVAAASLLLVHAWAPPIARAWNAPGWSTSVVLSFYALFPFAAARLGRLSRRWLLAAAAAAWVAALAAPAAYALLRPEGAHPELLAREPPLLETLKFHPIFRAPEFLVGVALGLWHRRGGSLGRAAPAAAALGVCGTIAAIAWGALPYLPLHDGLLAPLSALAVLGLAEGRGLLARGLASRPLRALGDASFALYAIQEPLWRIARAWPGSGAPPSPAFVAAFCAAAIGASLAVARWVERPARRFIRARLAAASVPSGERLAERARG